MISVPYFETTKILVVGFGEIGRNVTESIQISDSGEDITIIHVF